MSCTRVDLLEPVPPRIPTVMPELMCRSIFSRALRLAFLEYLKLTFSKSMEPSLTSITGSAGLCRLLSSTKTWQIRFADSADMVTITYIMEIIIRLISICMP